MRHDQVIYLITETITSDSIGNQVKTPSERMVYANEFSVGASEFYAAAQTDLKPERSFEVYAFEYQGETRLKHDGVTYKIIRTQGKGEKLRLTCERA